MAKPSVTFSSRIGNWSSKKEHELDVAVLDRMTATLRDAVNLAPVLTRALVNSGRVKREGEAHYSVIFGGGQVPYAKMRHYVNKKNPQTRLYLKRPGDANARELINDIRRLK